MIKEAYNHVINIIVFKRYSNLWIAIPLSFICIPFLCSYADSFVAPKDSIIFSILFEDVKTKNMVVPVITETIGILFYILFNVLDLITGLQASKWENLQKANPDKKWVKPERLYKTLWKLLGVLFMTALFTVLALLMEIFKSDSFFFWAVMWALVVFWIMAIGFDFYSCGENLERRYGSKPAIFAFWDKILNAFEKKAISKIDSL